MNVEEPTTQGSASSETPPSNVPEDFAGYVRWRKTGEPPAEAAAPQQPAAAAEEQPPPAKSEPQSGAEEEQQKDEEEDEQGEPQSAAGRRGGQRQRKIDRLTREVAELKAQLGAAAPPKPQETEPSPGEPRLENFETLEQYQRALTKWQIKQIEAERQAEADQKAAIEAEQKLQTGWESKQKAARKAHPDYDDVIEATAAPEGPGVLAGRQAMLEDEAGAEILYYLASHPDDLKRIAALQPIAAVREIGRLSAILSPPSTANGNQRFTAAPKPPSGPTRPAKPMSDSINDPAVQNDFRRWAKLRTQMKDK